MSSDSEPPDTLPDDSLPPHPLSDSDDEDAAGERQGVCQKVPTWMELCSLYSTS